MTDRLLGRRARVELWNPGTVIGMFPFKNHLLYSTSSSLYNRGVLISSSWGGWFDAMVINQWAYLANATTFVRTDGTNLYEVGITAPVVGSFAAAGTGSGAFTVGDWDYVVTFVDSDGFESNMSTSITASSQGASKTHCALTAIPLGSSDEDVASRKLYRTSSGGGVFYYLDEIEDNTTTTYTDITTDANLGASTPPVNHDKPTTTFKTVCSAGDRWFASLANSRRLYFSLPYPNERAMPSTYYVDFPDYIVSVKALGTTSIVVVCENQPYVLSGLTNPDLFYYAPMMGPVFYTKSSRVAKTFRGGVVLQGTEGIYALDGTQSALVSQNIRGLLGTLSESAVGAVSPEEYFLIVNSSSLNVNVGVPIYILHDSDEATFEAGDPAGEAELGVIVKVVGQDEEYVFTSEVGVIVHLGTGDQGQVYKWDTRNGSSEFFSYTFGVVNSGDVQVLVYDNRSEIIYVGGTNGVHSLTGNYLRYTIEFGDSYLGYPNRYKWLQQIHIGYLKGTLKASLYLDGSSNATHESERTLYANNTSVYANDATVGADGQTYHDGPVSLKLPSDLVAVTFRLKLEVCGELHAPILFSGKQGELI